MSCAVVVTLCIPTITPWWLTTITPTIIPWLTYLNLKFMTHFWCTSFAVYSGRYNGLVEESGDCRPTVNKCSSIAIQQTWYLCLFNNSVSQQGWLASHSSFIQAWDWHCWLWTEVDFCRLHGLQRGVHDIWSVESVSWPVHRLSSDSELTHLGSFMCLCECLDIRVSELQLFSVSGIGSDCELCWSLSHVNDTCLGSVWGREPS